MKIAIIGGPDVDARLPLLQRLREQFAVAALGSSPTLAAKFRDADVEYGHYPLSRRVALWSDVRSVRTLTQLLRSMRPDVVHSFDTKPGVYGSIAAHRAGVPVRVCTVTGLGSLYSSGGWRNALLRRVYEALQRRASRAAQATVFQNRDDLQQLVGVGVVPAARAELVLGSGVETGRFDPAGVDPNARARLRAEFGIPIDAVVVTMIARVTRTKGVLEFAAAAREVRQRLPQARFLLIGPADDDSPDRLRSDETTALREAVVWPGPRRDIVEVLAASDVFVLPTAYREGIPRVLLEAASMGLPIVTTDSPGCNEVVRSGDNGEFVPAGNPTALAQPIERLVGDPTLRRRFGAESRRRAVTLFDLDLVAAQLRALYLRLLDEAQRNSDAGSPVLNRTSR